MHVEAAAVLNSLWVNWPAGALAIARLASFALGAGQTETSDLGIPRALGECLLVV